MRNVLARRSSGNSSERDLIRGASVCTTCVSGIDASVMITGENDCRLAKGLDSGSRAKASISAPVGPSQSSARDVSDGLAGPGMTDTGSFLATFDFVLICQSDPIPSTTSSEAATAQTAAIQREAGRRLAALRSRTLRVTSVDEAAISCSCSARPAGISTADNSRSRAASISAASGMHLSRATRSVGRATSRSCRSSSRSWSEEFTVMLVSELTVVEGTVVLNGQGDRRVDNSR